MPLSSLSSEQLQRVIQLIKEKEALQARLAELNSALNALDSGEVTAAKSGRPRRGRRFKRKEAILQALQTAGKQGLSVKEVAEQLKANPSSVSVWFYTTGKKIQGLKKIAPGRYRYGG